MARFVEPFLIILASRDDRESFAPFHIPDPLMERISQIDFDHSFLVLVKRGQSARGLVKSTPFWCSRPAGRPLKTSDMVK